MQPISIFAKDTGLKQTGQASSGRTRVITFIAIVMALVLALCLAVRAWQERGSTNSYALVAQALLAGKPYVEGCFDVDCAKINGQTYIVFPPAPGVVAIPLIVAFGVGTRGFLALAIGFASVSLLLWWRIFAQLGLDRERRIWLIAAMAFASPLFFVMLQSNHIWSFAQAVAFPFVTIAIHEALAGRLITSGAALAFAMLSRQMSIVYAPLLLLLSIPPDRSLWTLCRVGIRSGLRLGVPILFGIILYLLYNAWRFGNPLDSGYGYISFPPVLTGPRMAAHGLWSAAYVPFNAFYMFLQGFHANFADPEQVKLVGLDSAGTSILAASPWLIFLFFTPIRRDTIACGLLVAVLVILMLFYHSNGFGQFNTQRYALEWLPAAWLMLAQALKERDIAVFRLLVVWGMVLNVAMIGVFAITHVA